MQNIVQNIWVLAGWFDLIKHSGYALILYTKHSITFVCTEYSYKLWYH